MRPFEELEPDIVIVDINMPIMDGVEMMKQTHEAHPYSAIVLSGYSSFDYAKDAMKYGAIRYLPAAEKDELSAGGRSQRPKRGANGGGCGRPSRAHSSRFKNFSIDLELPGSGIPDPVVSAMLDYAAAHYQEKVALQDVANALNYSIAFLNKRFKKQTGTTFIEYLNRYRIQKALELMKNGKLPLHEISWQCGIGDYKYFNTVFRKYLGCGPKEYGADRRLAEVSSKRGTFHRVSRFLRRL